MDKSEGKAPRKERQRSWRLKRGSQSTERRIKKEERRGKKKIASEVYLVRISKRIYGRNKRKQMKTV